jgi:copper(I)-binding protein
VAAAAVRALLAVPCLAAATAGASPVFVVAEPWVRPAAAGAATEAYMELRSSEPVTLTAVRSEVAARIAVVDARGEATSLAIEAGQLLRLAPKASRIRLPHVNRALRRGDHVPLTLTIVARDGTTQDIPVEAEVRTRSPSDDHHVPHAH